MRTRVFSLTLTALAFGAPLASTSPPGTAESPALEAAPAQAPEAPTVTVQQSGTTNRLQAISPVTPRIVWASGVGGTFAVTTDGGETWRAGVVSGAEALQFRDVEGVNARVAYLLSAGVGTDSRIYKTEDGGETWTLQFQNEDPNGFYDCFAFWTPKRGITMADAIDGRFPVVRTVEGESWEDIGDRLPAAQPGEAASRQAAPAPPRRVASTAGSPPAARSRRASWQRPTGATRGPRTTCLSSTAHRHQGR